MYDTLIRGGKLVFPGVGVLDASLAVAGGRIAAILGNGEARAAEVIDATGCHVLPGVIDPHVHIAYGGSWQDRLGSESASAAVGGVTTLISFYRQNGPYEDVLRDDVAAIPGRSLVDISVHLGLLGEGHLDRVGTYPRSLGVTSFKLYMAYRGAEGQQLGFQNEMDDGFILEAFRRLAAIPGAIACVHCENVEVAGRLKAGLQSRGRVDLAAWNESRPGFAEAENAQRAAYLAEVAGCPLYIVHVSSRETLRVLGARRREGPPLFVETCPHYLTHTDGYSGGLLGKVNPPLREPADNEALWKALADGGVDTVGTDHCAAMREKKSGDIWEAWPGFAGTATLLPVLLSEGVNRGRLSLERVAEVTSANPARIFGFGGRKGTLAPGADADLVLVDLAKERVVEAPYLRSASDFSLYEGWRLKGWPVLTMVRGRVAMRDGEILGQGGGAFLRRAVG